MFTKAKEAMGLKDELEPAPVQAPVVFEPQLPGQMPQVVKMITDAIANPQITVDTLRELFQLQKDVMAHQAKMDYAAALARFNEHKRVVFKNKGGTTAGDAPFQYSDLPEIEKTIRPGLTACGLSFTHRTTNWERDDQGFVKAAMVYCTIRHISGHSEEYEFQARRDERTAAKLSPNQSIQAALTYARGKTLCDGLGIATGDESDDAYGKVREVTRPTRSQKGGPKSDSRPIPQGGVESIKRSLEREEITVAECCKRFKVKKLEELTSGQFNDVMNWIRNPTS